MSEVTKGKPRSAAQLAASALALAKGRENTRANKPGWIPTHRIGTKHSPETLAKMAEARRMYYQRKRIVKGASTHALA